MIILPEGNLKKIHVNGHHIRANKNDCGEVKPVFTVKHYEGGSQVTYTGHKVSVGGPVETRNMFIGERAQLSCGATIWLETRAAVFIETEV